MSRFSAAALSALVLVGLGCTGGANSQDAPEAPEAVSADPQHYSVQFENDVIRVLRIAYGPGETSVMHRHPANCAIFITATTGTFALPNGETVAASGTPGQVQCGDAEVHLPTNTGDAPFQVIVVELKGRAAFSQ